MNPKQPSIDPETQPEVFHQSSSKPFRWLWIAIIGFFLAVVGAGAYFLGTQNSKTAVSQYKNSSLSEPLQPSPTQTTDSTVNWKTYTNTKYNFAFKYPQTYLTREDQNTDGVFLLSSLSEKQELESCFKNKTPECNNYSLRLEFSNKSKSSNLSLTDFVKGEQQNTAAFTTTIIAGYPALQHRFEGIGIVENVYINRNTSVFHIYANAIIDADNNIRILDQILSTFRFENLTPSKSTDSNQNNQTNCSASDQAFCDLLPTLKTLVENGDFTQLTEFVEPATSHCDPNGFAYNQELCRGIPSTGSAKGYSVGYNQSEGSVLTKSQFVKTLNDYKEKGKPFSYHGSIQQGEKGIVVYLSKDKSQLFTLLMKKSNLKWRIESVLLGVTSKDFLDLDPVVLTYFQ